MDKGSVESRPSVLVVGAGAVGQVFGRHLHLGGARVTFLGRGSNFASRQVFSLYPLNRRNPRSRAESLSNFNAITELRAQDIGPWDQIYLCVPSDALTNGLLSELANVDESATIVKIQPGLDDRQAYTSHFSESRLVAGMMAFISYEAPLEGETVPESGIAYWFPPLIKSRFSGPTERRNGVVELLRAGGFPALEHPNVERLLGWVLAAEAPLTAGLECAGWSLSQFRRSRWLLIACRAIQEAANIVATYHESNPPNLMRLIHPLSVRLALAGVPKRNPIPLEAYLKHHFSKVQDQSLLHLHQYISSGEKMGLRVGALRLLQNTLLDRVAGI